MNIGVERIQPATSAGRAGQPRRRLLAGGSAVLLGVTLVGYLFAFGFWLASTGVSIAGDPAAQPARMAQQLINGSSSPMWVLYVALAAIAILAFQAASHLADRTGSRPASHLGSAALTMLALKFLITAAVTLKAGSVVLPAPALQVAIPVLFSVMSPGLLSAFCMIAAAWTISVSWAGWRSRSMPAWLCAVGALTGAALLGGITGAAGVELIIAPWLLCAGGWMLKTSGDAAA